jgi:fluoroquinolone transport system permease protein
MSLFISQLKWQMILLARNSLIGVSVAMTIAYATIFYFIKDLPNTDKFLTLLIFNDPVTICLFFVGVSIIIEKNEGVFRALFVTPINLHTYLLAKILALTIIGWACAVGMTVAMLGFGLSWGHFTMGLLSTCAICGIIGIYLVSFTQEFLPLTLRAVPILLFLCLPMLNYFNLTDSVLFDFTPMHGPLTLIIYGYQGKASLGSLWWAYAFSLSWIVMLYWGGFVLFRKRVINAL